MLRIEIKTSDVIEKKGTSPKTGKPYSIREQVGYAIFQDRNGNVMPYPSPVSITLDNSAQPYPPGFYTLADSSFYTGDFAKLQVRVMLQPLPAAAVKAAA